MDMEDQFVKSQGVFWRSVGDSVFLRNVFTFKEFLFNSVCGHILEYFKDPHSLNEFDGFVENTFAGEDRATMISEMRDFVEELIAQKNLIPVEVPTARVVPSDDIRRMVNDTCVRNGSLWNVGLELTHRCNERCSHCYVEQSLANPQKELTTNEWLNILEQLEKIGCARVLVTGGEPTLHNGFLQICKAAVDRGMLLDIFTNGLVISEHIFNGVADLPINSISVSLYGGTPDGHDQITGVIGSFEKTLLTLLKFKSCGKDVFVKTPALRGHLESVKRLKSFLDRLGIPLVLSEILVPTQKGLSRENFVLTEREYRDYLSLFQSSSDMIVRECEAGKRTPHSPICNAGITTIAISPYGEVKPCVSYGCICGSAKNQKLKQIWENSRKLDAVRNLTFAKMSPQCLKCVDFDFCTVCAGASYAYRNKVEVVPYLCAQARIRHSILGSTTC